jgi:excisionase family DNA binding protein
MEPLRKISQRTIADLSVDELRSLIRDELEAVSTNGHGAVSPVTDEVESQRERVLDAGGLLTAEQLAVMLQVHKATLYERVKKKTIPYHQAGRFVRFDFHEVLESQRKKNENTP